MLLPSMGCDGSPNALASLAAWDVTPVPAERIAELRALVNRARAAGDKRNNIMHALTWFSDQRQAGGSVPTIVKVKGSGLVTHPMPVERVEELAKEIADITRDLGQFMFSQFFDDVRADPQPLLGRGTLWESTVKGALSWYTKGPQPTKDHK